MDNNQSKQKANNIKLELPQVAVTSSVTEQCIHENQSFGQIAFQDNENVFREVANSVRDAIILVDNEARVTFWNPSAVKIFGYSNSEAVGKNIHELVVPKSMCADGRTRIEAGVKTFAEIGLGYFTVGNIEVVGCRKDGSEFPAKLSISPLKMGEKWSAVGVVKDITERKVANQKLRDAEQQYHALFNHAPLGVLVVNPETASFVEFNDLAHTQLAYSREDFEKLTIYDIEANQSPEEVRSIIKKVLSEGGTEFNTKHRTKTGELRDVLVTVKVFQSFGKKQLYCIFHDITERKQLEDNLRHSEEKFRAISTSAMDAILLVDDEDKVLYWNPAAEHIFGFKEEEAISKDFSTLVIPKTARKSHRALLMKTRNTGFQKKNFTATALRKDGSQVPIDLSVSSVFLKNKKCMLAIIRDISRQKQMETSLKQERNMLEDITKNIGAGLVIVDKEYRIIWTNNYLRRINGDTVSKICYSTFNSLKTPCVDCGPKKIFDGAEYDSREYFNRELHAKGLPCWFELISTPIKGKDGNVIAALELTVDITEKKDLEKKILQERNKLKAITENVNAGLIVINREYEATWLNKVAQKWFGQTANKKCFKTFHGKETICENCGVKKVFAGKAMDVRTVSFDSKDETRTLEVTTTPMKDDDGNIVAALELAMDVTDIKKMQGQLSRYSQQLEDVVKKRTYQLEQTQTKLVKSERLAAIGELAGMVGHDLRNPLTGIKNSAYLLKKKGNTISEAQSKEMLEIIENCVNYSNKIVNDLLDYSRDIHLELHESSVDKLLTQAIAMLAVPETIDIQVNCQDQPIIEVDPGKIERVFINLIKNAIDAMQNVGKISIDCKEIQGSMEISFADTGMGISDEILPKLFSPLVTTKAQGMGFGLAICKRIVEAHGGTIKVKTAVGKGATFTVSIPIKQPNRFGGDVN